MCECLDLRTKSQRQTQEFKNLTSGEENHPKCPKGVQGKGKLKSAAKQQE